MIGHVQERSCVLRKERAAISARNGFRYAHMLLPGVLEWQERRDKMHCRALSMFFLRGDE
jgi:hypothetical protein